MGEVLRWSGLVGPAWFLVICFLVTAGAVPIDTDKTKVTAEAADDGQKSQSSDTGLYYDRYLREVVEILETDQQFREKIQSADIEDIKSGRISKELDLVGHHIRTRLDELKRREVSRLRMLIKAKLSSPEGAGIDRRLLLQQFNHLNHMNPDSFEPQDLDLLIKAATKDLENYDKERHEEFKRYEMMKEHERRERLKGLDEEGRRLEEERHQERRRRHKEHPKINHPGSKDQLKEVWEETDGLDPSDFDPKTFFKLHDTNSDGFIDEQELEALFTKELDKAYDPKNEEDDMVEMEEERLRMREHVMNEVDVDKDRLINIQEFLRATEKREFLEPDDWETLDERDLFTEEELQEFEKHITKTEDELRRKREDLERQQEELNKQHQHIQAQRQELQQVVQQIEQKKQQPPVPHSVPDPGDHFQPDALRVTMKAPLISVMRDEDVTIPCEFTDFIPGKTINVGWKKLQNGNSSNVYIYIPGRPQSFRPGAHTEEESEIRRGNAALHIPRVQYSDDGEYICNVVVTPKEGEGRSTLQVSAVPSAVLVPGDVVTVEKGSEKSVSCEISNFYPKDINIRWVRYEKDSSKYVTLERGTCTGDTITNTDGTFSVISHLTLYPTMEDNGNRYSCVVKHRTLDQDLKMKFTLTVTEREDNTGTVVTAVVLTTLSIILPLLAFFLYNNVYNKDPPRLSEITGNDQLIDMNRTTLTCHIMNFKPNYLEIFICLKRSGQEMRTIHTWRSRDPAPSAGAVMDDNDGESSVTIDIEQQRLMNGAVSHTQGPLQLEMTPVITPNRSGLLRYIPWRRLYTYSCQCSVHITPSYTEDNGAEFSVHVSHPALTNPIHQKRILKVIGVPPILLKIVRPEYVTHGERMTLTCPITAFKPKPIQITWARKDKSDREMELITWNSKDETDRKGGDHKVTENELDDKSYSLQSTLMMRPNMREDGDRYICRTFHPATDHRAEEELVLKVTAVPVLGPITQTLGKTKINVGDTMSLSCKIHSFYPKPIEVTWYTEDGRILPSTISDFLPDQSCLYHVTSSITYITTIKDLGKTFTCDVRHESTEVPKTATWTLQDLGSKPTVSEIRCDPPSPECDKMVTLSCDVSDLYPKNIVVIWYKGINRIQDDMCRVSIHEDPECVTSQGTAKLHFQTDPECHEDEYRMELIHSGKTIVRKYKLILKGFPVLCDITSDPSDPIYGHPVTLYCKVTNAKPEDIKIHWLKGEKPVEKGQGEEKQITEKDGSVSCSLRIMTTTALDYGKAYTCSVTHKDMEEPLKKNHYIALPDKIPMFSDITVRPERPVAGHEAIFTVTISGFTPDIKVKWYKDYGPFPSDVITTSDPQIGKDFLCTCSSSLRFSPKDSDNMASIRCEATHSVTKKVHEKRYALQLPGSLKTALKT